MDQSSENTFNQSLLSKAPLITIKLSCRLLVVYFNSSDEPL